MCRRTFEPARFDQRVSRLGGMFLLNPAPLTPTWRLRPGGRLCFVCWQGLDKNEWARVPLAVATRHVPLPAPASPDAPGPFAFANSDRVRRVLESGGFSEVNLEPHEAALTMGGATTVAEAVNFTLEIGPVSRLLGDVSADIRTRVAADLHSALAPYASGDGVQLGGAACIVTARRK
jgi:hypothetical protein